MNLLVKEIKIYFTGIMFYTRIPCPKWIDHSEENLNKSTKYFPSIGWIVGGITGLLFYLLNQFLTPEISIVISMIAGILLTGAFHEDGFADFCDGFGGGWTKSKILEIMKDSRIGTYGSVGLILILLLKYFLLNSVVYSELPFVLIAGHSLSRLSAISIIYCSTYSRDDELSKVKPIGKKISFGNFLIAIVLGIIPMFLLNSYWYFSIIIPTIFVTVYLTKYFEKWLDGYTGDCLGATQQINEIVFYISYLALWKYI